MALDAFSQRLTDLKQSIGQTLQKLEAGHEHMSWPSLLDSFALLSGQVRHSPHAAATAALNIGSPPPQLSGQFLPDNSFLCLMRSFFLSPPSLGCHNRPK